MKWSIAVCLTCLLLSGFSSCEFERKEENCIAYVKKNTMEPFSDFVVKNGRVQLAGNVNAKLPVGEIDITLWGESKFGLFEISYWRRIEQQEFKPEFDFSEVGIIELLTEGTSYTQQDDSLKIIYDQIMQDFKREKASCSISFDLPAWCFGKLQHPETHIGFTRHFSQHIGSRPMLLKYPFIKINEFVFTDMKKKGILEMEDTVYLNCGGRGYNYRKVGELNLKSLK